jgi:hypothetical protein
MDELEECSRVPPNGVVQREPTNGTKKSARKSAMAV